MGGTFLSWVGSNMFGSILIDGDGIFGVFLVFGAAMFKFLAFWGKAKVANCFNGNGVCLGLVLSY